VQNENSGGRRIELLKLFHQIARRKEKVSEPEGVTVNSLLGVPESLARVVYLINDEDALPADKLLSIGVDPLRYRSTLSEEIEKGRGIGGTWSVLGSLLAPFWPVSSW